MSQYTARVSIYVYKQVVRNALKYKMRSLCMGVQWNYNYERQVDFMSDVWKYFKAYKIKSQVMLKVNWFFFRIPHHILHPFVSWIQQHRQHDYDIDLTKDAHEYRPCSGYLSIILQLLVLENQDLPDRVLTSRIGQ